MPTLAVDPTHPDPAAIARAAALLRAGALVAFPTETVYGLGAHALDAAAVRSIYVAKGRPSYNPLILHTADLETARALATAWPDAADRLARRFWPGPLTLVLPKRADVPDEATAGLPSVAVRVPAHPVALALLRAADVPVAAPSANRFTELSPTTARHVERALGDRVALVLDGGPTSVGIESTIVDLTGDVPVLLRPGLLSAADLEPVLGAPLGRPAAVSGEAPRPAPGMIDRHYAPRAKLLRVRAFPMSQHEAAVVAYEAPESGLVGALVLGEREPAWTREVRHVIRMPADAAGYASQLYATLHALDDAGCTLVLVEEPPEEPSWAGVRDRLARAGRRI